MKIKSKSRRRLQTSKDKSRKEDPLQLDRIIGQNVMSSVSIASSLYGDIFLAAGCYVILYDAEEKCQKAFFRASKSVSCLSVSCDGKLLAIGERGHMPSVMIWDVLNSEQVACLSGHKHGIGCLAFSPDGHYLVSVGFKHDRQLILWEWATQRIISSQTINNKVNSISFNEMGTFFVTCGDRHMKWWYIVRGTGGEVVNINGKPATILENFKEANFVQVICGIGEFKEFVYSSTSNGILCSFHQSRLMDRWLQLDSSSSYCLALSDSILSVGCADGLVRFFSLVDLSYISTLPLPNPLPPASVIPLSHPACYAAVFIGNSQQKMVSIYADRSLYIWDIRDLQNIHLYQSNYYHHGCVWDLNFIDNNHAISSTHISQSPSVASTSYDHIYNSNDIKLKPALPSGCFVTCSADNSICFWSINSKEKKSSVWKSKYSNELLHCICMDDEDTSSTQSPSDDQDLRCSIPDLELPDRPRSDVSPRALAVHPNGREVACGDRSGRLRVFELDGMKQLYSIQAHDAEVLTLHYSPPLKQRLGTTNTWDLDLDYKNNTNKENTEQSLVMLASAGRDRLIHVFDASNNYVLLTTLDDHSSSVTTVKFTADGKRLISCGGDKTMVFSSVNGKEISRLKSVQTPNGTINGLALVGATKFAVTSGQDRRLNIWNVSVGKHIRAYKHESVTGELYKCDVDPAGESEGILTWLLCITSL